VGQPNSGATSITPWAAPAWGKRVEVAKYQALLTGGIDRARSASLTP